MDSQQPYVPPVPPAPPGPAPRPPRRNGTLAVALVVGLLLGGGGVGAAWALAPGDDGTSAAGSGPAAGPTPDPAAASGPAADAAAACGALDRFDESKYAAEGDEGLVALNRWSGAVTLSAAAAAGDSRYEPLGDALDRASTRQNQVFEFDATVKKYMTRARAFCKDL